MKIFAVLLVLAAAAAASAERLSAPEDYADYPAAAVAPNGDLWLAFLSYDQHGSDVVKVRRRTADGWQPAETITPAPGDFLKTAAAATLDGALWIAWAAQVEGNFDIYARAFDGKRWSPIRRLTEAPGADFHHRLAADAKGNLYLVWQSFRTGDGNIYLKVFDGIRWSEAIAVSSHEASEWEPAIALDSQDRLYIAYDTYRHGDYDVFLRVFENGALGPEIPIADSPDFEARAAIAIDKDDRAWIAWDNQGPNWALDMPHWNIDSSEGDWGAPADWSAPDPRGRVGQKVGLRYTQGIGIAVYAQGRRWIPRASIASVLPDEPPAGVLEIPHLAVDGSGVPWLFFRRWLRRNDGGGMAERPMGWRIYASAYETDRWTEPIVLEDSAGSNDNRPAVVLQEGASLDVFFAADGRYDAAANRVKPIDRRHGFVAHRKIEPPRRTSALPPPELHPVEPGALRGHRHTAAGDRRNEVAAGTKRYRLYWGDLHRHTEISSDGGYDGTLWDMYRYAIDVAELDFIASTDHSYGGAGKDGLLETYDWWRTQKLADVFHLPGVFMPLFGYERTPTFPYGHRNVISPNRGAVAIPITVPREERNTKFPRRPDELALWKALKGSDAITIPHTIAAGGGTDWSYHDPAFQTLLEIYQGCRLSYEGRGAPRVNSAERYEVGYAQNALTKGYKMGFIASSDHRSTHISYAAVYAEEPTRQGIFRALRQRHAYAATDNIVVDVRVGEAIMGDETTTSEAPVIRIAVRGTAPIDNIQIIKDNQYLYSLRPGTRNVAFAYRDGAAEPGESYYYVRLQQTDGQMAWASPIWVDYRP